MIIPDNIQSHIFHIQELCDDYNVTYSLEHRSVLNTFFVHVSGNCPINGEERNISFGFNVQGNTVKVFPLGATYSRYIIDNVAVGLFDLLY